MMMMMMPVVVVAVVDRVSMNDIIVDHDSQNIMIDDNNC